MGEKPAIAWLRRDFRLHDNPALQAAASAGKPVIPLYIHAPEENAPWQPGGASNWWRHNTISKFATQLQKKGSRLVTRSGPSEKALEAVIAETGADAVFWNRLYEPTTIPRDIRIKELLKGRGINVQTFGSALLFEPKDAVKEDGTPYQVFTPFWKFLQKLDDPQFPLAVPALKSPASWPDSLKIEDLGLLPKINWAGGLCDAWKPGEDGGLEWMEEYLAEAAHDYKEGRDRPDRRSTSRISPYLHHGDVSPRTVWHMVRRQMREKKLSNEQGMAFLRQLVWREFSCHLLYHHPHTAESPLRGEFASFPWVENEELFRRWRQGRTGYDFVDAGMRELWHTGWMHNRVRMVVASFLVKHLRIHWLRGARWFWDTLVDADLANNTMGWQWTAGCGADAAPYFRVFNPMLQAEKFDPEGKYRHHWLSQSPAWRGNRPEEANFLEPIVQHDKAREEALVAYELVKKSKADG